MTATFHPETTCGPVWWDKRKKRWCFSARRGCIVENIYLWHIRQDDKAGAVAARDARVNPEEVVLSVVASQ